MKISKGKTVSIEYSLALDNGEPVDSNAGREPLTFIQGDGQIIAGLEQALEGMEAGENKTITVQPEDAYGPMKPDALIQIPKDHLPPEAWEVGAHLTAEGPQGQQIQGIVAKLEETAATVDFNHPLAGSVLHFDISVLTVK